MITKIQSFTDVITNSSSTVFVMSESFVDYYDKLENTYNCITIEKIDMNWLHNHDYEFEMICDILKIDPGTITSKNPKYHYWEDPDSETWNTFLQSNKEQIEEVFKDLYWVDIEDHFENAWEVNEQAHDDAIWSDYRH